MSSNSRRAYCVWLLAVLLLAPSPSWAWWSSAGASATLTAIGGGFWSPELQTLTTTGSALDGTTGTIALTGSEFAQCFIVPKTGTLNRANFLVAAITQDPANGITVSFQDPAAANGDPDDTADEYRTGVDVSAAWITPGLMTSDGTDTGVKRAVTKGQLLCLNAAFTTFIAGDSIRFGALDESAAIIRSQGGFANYSDTNVAGWTKSQDTWAMVLEYNDGSYANINSEILPFATLVNDTTFNTGTTPDEYAMSITFPVSVAVDGMGCFLDLDGDVDFVLYEGTTARATVSADKDIDLTTGDEMVRVYFPDYTLTANTTYYVTVKPTSATDTQFFWYTVSTANILNAAGGTAGWFLNSRTDAGAWDASATTSRPICQVHVSKILG